MNSKLLGIQISVSNAWLLFPVIYLDPNPGNVTLDFVARAFYKLDTSPVRDTCKAHLYVLAASTIDSLNGNHVVDTIDVVDITTDWSKVSVNLSACTEHTQLAFFLVRDADGYNYYLQVDSFDIDYRSITCLGITNLQTSNLTSSSVTISWEGTALEYGVFYTNTEKETEDTVYTESTEVMLENLDAETLYTYYVEPYCGEDHTNPGPVSDGFFTTEKGVGNGASALNRGFAVSSSAGRISIINPSAMVIDRVEVVSVSGVVLQQKSVRTSGNILLPAIKTPQVAVVKITSGGNEYTEKILVKQ
jgi:hypothetical protein